jgi:hypothetical protein
MRRHDHHSEVLRWYPKAWRDHYGDELAMFLDDRYGERSVPLWARLSMMRSGLVERLRVGGMVGRSVDSDQRVRGASLLVLCAWGVFVVAGAAFAKYTEHWPLATPRGDQRLPAVAMGTVQVAAFAGVLIVLVAGFVTLPAFVNLVRSDGWRSLWPTMRVMVVTTIVAGMASIAVIAWNQHLGPSQANTSSWAWKAVGATWGLLVIGALAGGAGTVVALVNRLRLTHRSTQALGLLAMAMAAVLAVIFAGTLTWWISTAIHAPWFFGSLAPRSPISPAPLAMVTFSVMMLSGLALAGFGTVRIVGIMSLPSTVPTPSEPSE